MSTMVEFILILVVYIAQLALGCYLVRLRQKERYMKLNLEVTK